MEPLVVRRRVAAVNGLCPVEFRVTPRHIVNVEIGDVAVGVGVERRIGRICLQLHDLLELVIVLRLGPPVRLHQCLHGLVHQGDGDPAIGVGALSNGRAVMRAENFDRPLCHRAVRRLVGDLDGRHDNGAFLGAELIKVLAVLFYDLLVEFVDDVSGARRVHPAEAGIEALIDKELSPRRRTVGVEPFAAGHLQL